MSINNWLHCYCQNCHYLCLNKIAHYQNVSRVKIKYKYYINFKIIKYTGKIYISITVFSTRKDAFLKFERHIFYMG
jgi:hypothetical protein